jgi:hypothetical protein
MTQKQSCKSSARRRRGDVRRIPIVVALLLAGGSLRAADQAYFRILAETKVMRVAGMQPMPALPQGVDLSKLPGVDASKIAAALGMASGAPQRSLEIRLWSPGVAPPDAFAYVTPPPGLKQGSKLDLEVYRPKPEQVAGGTFNPEAVPEFAVKIYWGSSESVRPGQPKVIRWGALTAEQKALMRRQASRAASASYLYKPDWATAYWPTERQPGTIAKEASLVGKYDLTTNYTGNVSIEAPGDVEFLAPIQMTNPDLARPAPLGEAMRFEWGQIPNALGLHAMIVGMEGKNTLVIWNSSEVYTDEVMGMDWGYLEMAKVAELVNATVMMRGDRTSVTVPAGIFSNCEAPFFMMVGYGPGAALAKGQPLPRIQTKTTLNVMLGGKAMQGMGSMAGE